MNQEIKNLSVLIIDDEIDNAKKEFLKNTTEYISEQNGCNFQFEYTDDPFEVLEQLTYSEVSYDAILLDIDFSKLKVDEVNLHSQKTIDKQQLGIFILKEIKKIDPTIPVLMLTVITNPFLAADTGRYQADDYITKLSISGKKGVEYLCEKIYSSWKKCNENPIYDTEHLGIADEYSRNYDKDEQEKVATIAYLHFENEIIKEEINKILSEVTERSINILDLGCGTGRIESLIDLAFNEAQKKLMNITAVDFSGKMLKVLKQKRIALPNLKIIRSPAEVFCSYNTELDESSFDLVIAGFGFCSYVNYKALLLPHKGRFGGIAALINQGGKILFSVYNENSIIYDRTLVTELKDDLPIAALVDLRKGILDIPGYKVIAEAFSPTRFVRMINQTGLKIDESKTATFPTIHISLNNSECKNSHEFIVGGDPLFKEGRFNKDLYKIDLNHSKILKNKGHYIVMIAYKPEEDKT